MDTRLELGFTRLGPRDFRRQMESLARLGYRTLASTELLAAAPAPAPGDPNPVVLTFDDGYAELARFAFPVLADLGFRALVFVVTDFVGRENSWDVQYGWRRFRHLDWDSLGRWQERGIEVHSHGVRHARLTWLADAEVSEELGRSREAIARELGRAPAGISYPFGATDLRVRDLAASAGYSLGFAGPDAAVAGDPLRLPRLGVYAWDRFAPPLVTRAGPAGGLARAVARVTSRCAVGTAAIQRLLGREYRR